MVNAYHKVSNARNAMLNVEDHPATTDVVINEQLGHAEISFRFSEDASLQAAFAMRDLLVRNSFNELTDDSQIGEVIRFEWDKQALTED